MLRLVEERVDVAQLDDAPRVHDDDAVGELGDQAEVVGDEDDRRVRLALGGLDHLHDLGLDRHVERRRRLVGDEHRRRVGDGHGDHPALPHATRELVRVLAVALLGIGHADEREQVDDPPLRLVLARLRGLCARIASAIWLPTVSTGFSDVIGSWKIIAMSPPRILRSSSLFIVSRSRPLKIASPLAMRPGGCGMSPSTREHGDALPRAGLADDAEHLAREELVAHARDGLHDAVLRLELDGQVVDREDRVRASQATSLGALVRA